MPRSACLFGKRGHDEETSRQAGHHMPWGMEIDRARTQLLAIAETAWGSSTSSGPAGAAWPLPGSSIEEEDKLRLH
jgi:hypothetical protein